MVSHGDRIRGRLYLRVGVFHGHATAGPRQHFDIVGHIPKGNSLLLGDPGVLRQPFHPAALSHIGRGNLQDSFLHGIGQVRELRIDVRRNELIELWGGVVRVADEELHRRLPH